MKVGVLAVGQVAPEVLNALAQGLERIFPDTNAFVIKQVLPLPKNAYDKTRKQYSSSLLLNVVKAFTSKRQDVHRVLGVVDVDIFVAGLNYVFGEAYTPGSAGLISLWRLRQEFYGAKSDQALFGLRTLKEAVHELGHTLGLQHCRRSVCVMYFSNCIFDTDKKQSFFCDQCYLQASIAISNVG
ncbi:MAG: archaemetzincin family Zn-dependent metalloprotease [Candidatus Bathyarchaeota archaeon]|nr:archaemetzincin family Zn-dependent metalloprotease [Candidatus Bathyarchaeota archaeon]